MPQAPKLQEDAPQPVKGIANAGPTFIWYAAVTELPPPVALLVAFELAVIV